MMTNGNVPIGRQDGDAVSLLTDAIRAVNLEPHVGDVATTRMFRLGAGAVTLERVAL